MKRFLMIAFVLALSTGMAFATTTIYDSQGFESPDFALGALDGQGGFTGANAAGGTAPTVVTSGSGQAVQLAVGDTQGDASSIDFEINPITVDAGTIVTVSYDTFRTAPAENMKAQNFWYWWNDAGDPTYGLEWDAGQVLPFGFGGMPAAPVYGRFVNTTMVWDFGTGKANSWYDGVAVDTDYAIAGITTLSGWGFNFAHESDTGTGADTALLDNFQITVQQNAVPEPGSLVALGSGLFGLVGFAIRRRR